MGKAGINGFPQDFIVNASFVMRPWRQRKLKDFEAKRDILLSRARGAKGLLDEVDWFLRKEWELNKVTEQKRVVGMLKNHHSKSRASAAVDRWRTQFDPKFYGFWFRFIMLFFRGGSQQGKTQRAKAIMGPEHTLVVNFQGLSKALPG